MLHSQLIQSHISDNIKSSDVRTELWPNYNGSASVPMRTDETTKLTLDNP